MEFEELRSHRDCVLFRNIEQILKLNDLCRASQPKDVRDVCGTELYEHLLSRPKMCNKNISFLNFQKHWALIMLKHTITAAFEGAGNGVSINNTKQLNERELREYWMKIDDLSTEEANHVLGKLIDEQCALTSNKCYNKQFDVESENINCWICRTESPLMGNGRYDDVCGNNMNQKSTSFIDKNGFNQTCSHISINSCGQYDKKIVRRMEYCI